MARTATSIKLPWRESDRGLEATLGVRFCVELTDAGWQCSVGSGRGKKVIESGMRTRRAGKKAAEAHAVKVPEVMEALANQDAPARTSTDEDGPSGRGRKQSPGAGMSASADTPRMAPGADSGDSPAGPTRSAAVAGPVEISYSKVSDGSLFGRVAGACWIANRREVLFSGSVDPGDEQRVREAVAAHYQAEKDERRADLRAARMTRRAPARDPADTAEAKPAAVAKKKTAKVRGRRKKAAKVRAAAKTEGEAVKTTRGRKAAADGAAKATKEATSARRSKAPPEGEPVTTAVKGRGRAKKGADPVTKVNPGAKASVAAPAITWSEAHGLRGVAAHGTFAIEPEGQRFGLYFYDPAGQSRHLRSGEVAELRQAAEEMAARGLPAPERETLSASQTETLLRMFAGTGGAAT